jgi:hypothetical protein
VVPFEGGTTTSPSMIAEPALMCHASDATFLKRSVQSLPYRVKTWTAASLRWTWTLYPSNLISCPHRSPAGTLSICRRERRFNEPEERRFGAGLTQSGHGSGAAALLHVAVTTFVPVYKILREKWHATHLEITALSQFLRSVRRHILRPFFGGFEGNDPDGFFLLTVEHADDHSLQIRAFDFSFPVSPALSAAVADNEIDILVVAVRVRWTAPFRGETFANSNKRNLTQIRAERRDFVSEYSGPAGGIDDARDLQEVYRVDWSRRSLGPGRLFRETDRWIIQPLPTRA